MPPVDEHGLTRSSELLVRGEGFGRRGRLAQVIPTPPRGRLWAAFALSAATLAAFPPQAIAEPVNVSLTICLPPLPIPLLQCTTEAPGSTEQAEPQPGSVTPTEVRPDPRRIIVDFRRETTRRTIEHLWRRAGVSPVRTITKLGLYVVSAPEGKRDEALAALAAARSVESVEREVVVDGLDTTPNDPDWPDQWGLRRAGFPSAWDVTHGSRSVVVAVLDTGVDAAHPELRDALVPGRDIVNGDSDPGDDEGHGTAVAGVVAARTNNRIGLAGACWACSVMPVKVLGADGMGTTADVAAGIVWAANHGARVINLSLGAPGTTEALSEAVAYALSMDVVVVASAGNSSSETPFYPAAAPNVIGVAATNESDRLYSWSNRGPWVEVAAPGCSAAPWPKNGYVGFCGTSAAAPLVAGLAGLIRSAWPQATAIQVAAAVADSVEGVPADVKRGRINAALALSRLRPARSTVRKTTVFKGRLRKHRSRSHQLVVGPGPLTAVLRFGGARRLTLVLKQAGRGTIRVSGKSPLRLSRSVVSGPLTAVVQGRHTTYRLRISATAPGGA
jgi:subtilisin family serine protease